MNLYKHKVQYYETDQMGIVHHSNYIRWMEEARTDFLSQIGWNYAKLEKDGIFSPVTSVSCKYTHPATFEEEISIAVNVLEFKGVRFVLEYHMTNSKGESVCKGISEHCFLGSHEKLILLKKELPAFHDLMTKLADSSRLQSAQSDLQAEQSHCCE